jgi:bla regulator protein BlaR1
MTSAVFAHILESTAFAATCALMTLAFRGNRAQVRYTVWMAASAKFLIPFAALIGLGRMLGRWLLPPTAVHPFRIVLEVITQPLARTGVSPETRVAGLTESATFTSGALLPSVLVAIWTIGSLVLIAKWLAEWRQLARVAQRSAVVAEGREVTILRRLEDARRVHRHVVVLASDASMEPGVFGWFRPRLLWPRAISAHLSDSQIEAILAHELSHVRRYDNVIAALQMFVQAAFWFHPLVWWIGARLVDERERACDEEVLHHGSEPEVYAESILRTCRFSIEAPLRCVAGVTGADLKRRIEGILRSHHANALGVAKRIALSLGAVLTIVGPIAIGVLNGPRVSAQGDASRIGEQKFEVASVKPNDGKDVKRVALMMQPGGRLQAENVPLNMLVRFAYEIQEFQIVGLPDWKNSEHFDINAKTNGSPQPGQPGVVGPIQKMMQSLLAERFKLVAHLEKRDMPIYALVTARADGKLGPGLRPSTVDCVALAAERARAGLPPAPPPGQPMQCGFRIGPGQMSGGGMPLSQLAASLSNFVQRVVVDRTGLPGSFDLDLKYTLDQGMMAQLLGTAKAGALAAAPPNDGPAASDAPSLFTALQEQFGLKLESSRGPVDVLVVEHVDRPSPD